MKFDLKDPSDLVKMAKANVPQVAVPKQVQRVLSPVAIVLLLLLLFSGSWSGSMFTQRQEKFPRKIWQTWKVDPMQFEERDHKVAETWIKKNPEYRYEVLTDQNDMAYVETHFGSEGLNRLDIVYMYRELTAHIIKADLLRYMIMYIEGGLYTDIDVEALRPANVFIPKRWKERDIDMVIGVEIDQPEFAYHRILGQKCQSFCQWTFMCKPGLPVMMNLIEEIMLWLRNIAVEQGVPISQIKLDFDQVIAGTGPSAFTKAIMEEMSRREGRTIGWDMFHAMTESQVVGGVLVLTVEAFAAGQGHSDSGNHEAKQALVRHHYHASGWPTSHPRYNHPVYGEVEKCNWEVDCVREWDEKMLAFERLPAEEQATKIAEHKAKVEQEDRERKEKEDQEKKEKEAKEAKEKKIAEWLELDNDGTLTPGLLGKDPKAVKAEKEEKEAKEKAEAEAADAKARIEAAAKADEGLQRGRINL